MKIDRTKNTIRNMSWGYIYRFVNIVLPFAFRTVMIRTMGVEYLGINSLFASILQVLNLSELGFGSVMVFSMYKPIADNDTSLICAQLQFYRKIYRIIGCVVMGGGTIILPCIPYLISGGYPNDINIYFVYFLFLTDTAISYFFFAYCGSIISAFQRNDLESKILILVTLIRYSLEIAGIWITRQYYLYLFIEIFSTILTNILKLWCTKKMYPQYFPHGNISTEQKADIKKNVMALMFHKIGFVILYSSDNIVLSAFMGVVVVANYANYYYVLNTVESILVICFLGMTAGIGNCFVTESIKTNRENFKKILFFNAWIVYWCSICLLCLYQDFMELWVGREHMYSEYIIFLLVTYFYVHSIRRTIIAFRDGAGMWRDNRWQPIVSAACNVIVNIILVNIIGLAGVLISSIASLVIIDIPWEAVKLCNRIEMKTKEYLLALVKYFVITVVVGSVMFWGLSNIRMGPITNLLIKGCACAFAPNIIFALIYHKREEYRFFLQLIKKLLSKSNIT